MRIISGKYKRKRLISPMGILTRPSSDRLRETLMNILEGGKFGHPLNASIIIDIFAGTGALGIEAASRGKPKKVIFIDKDKNATELIKENIKITNSPEIFQIMNSDIFDLAKWENDPAELVFLDPPYFSNFFSKTLKKLIDFNALIPGAIIVLEASSKERIEKIKFFEELLVKKIGKSLIIFLKYSPSLK